MAQVKRGMLNNFGSALLIIALVYLLFSIAEYNNYFRSLGSNIAGLAGTDSGTASTNAAALLSNDLANVTFSGNNATFAGNITNILGNSLDSAAYTQFAGTYSSTNLSINATALGFPSINILPQQIRVNYSLGRVTFTPSNITTNYKNISGYIVLFTIDKPVPALNWTNISSVPASSPDAIYFQIGVQGTNGATSNSTYLNESKFSSLSLLDGSNITMISMQIKPPAALQINYNGGMNIFMQTTLELNSTPMKAAIDKNIININGGVQTSNQVILTEG